MQKSTRTLSWRLLEQTRAAVINQWTLQIGVLVQRDLECRSKSTGTPIPGTRLISPALHLHASLQERVVNLASACMILAVRCAESRLVIAEPLLWLMGGLIVDHASGPPASPPELMFRAALLPQIDEHDCMPIASCRLQLIDVIILV